MGVMLIRLGRIASRRIIKSCPVSGRDTYRPTTGLTKHRIHAVVSHYPANLAAIKNTLRTEYGEIRGRLYCTWSFGGINVLIFSVMLFHVTCVILDATEETEGC